MKRRTPGERGFFAGELKGKATPETPGGTKDPGKQEEKNQSTTRERILRRK